MILPVFLALISLSTMDPSGDAFGDGSLTPPTAPLYANSAVFDLQSVTLDATPNGTRLGVTLGALGSVTAGGGAAAPATEPHAPPDDTAAAVVEPPATEQPVTAFLPNIVDVYLGEVPGGFDATLPGPDLLFSQGSGWLYAVRMTGDGAYYVAYPTPSPEGLGAQASAIEDLPRVPLQVLSIEDTLVVYLPFTLPDDIAVQALVGVYDPFSRSGWRPLASSPSPWAFSGDGKQVSPVIDLIAPNVDAQRAALQSGMLPSTSRSSTVLTVPWLWVMLAGVLLAAFGLVLRGRVRRPVPVGASLPADATGEAVGEEPAAGTETERISGQELLAAGAVDDDHDLIAPRASAAGVLATDVAAADVAGGTDQALLVDGRDEFLLDTGGGAAAPGAEGAAAGAGQSANAGTVEAETIRSAEVRGDVAPPDLDHANSNDHDAQALTEDATAIEDDTDVAAQDASVEPSSTGSVASAEKARSFGATAEDSFLLDLDDPRAVEDFLSDDDEESFWHPRSRKAEPPTLPSGQLAEPQTALLPAPEPDEPAEPDENRGAD